MKKKFYLVDKTALKNIGKSLIETKDIIAVANTQEEMNSKAAEYLESNYEEILSPSKIEDIYQAISAVAILEQREELQPTSPIVHPIEWYYIQTTKVPKEKAMLQGSLKRQEVMSNYSNANLSQLNSIMVSPEEKELIITEYCFLGGAFEERLQNYCNDLSRKNPDNNIISGEIEVKNDEIIADNDNVSEEYVEWEYIEDQNDNISDYNGFVRFKRKVQKTLKNYYFTFGNNPQFPYHDKYLIVKAYNAYQATELFRACYPDRIEGIINCAFIYSEEEWQPSDKNPVEIIELKRTFKNPQRGRS